MKALALLALAAPLVASSALAQESEEAPAAAFADPQDAVLPQIQPRGWHPGLSAMIDGGASYRWLYSTPFYGSNLQLALGGSGKNAAVYGTVSGFFGRTEHGLPTYELKTGVLIEGFSERFRYGAGCEAGFLDMPRWTQPGDDMSSLGVGLAGHVSYDVWQSDKSAVMLGGRISGTAYLTAHGDGPAMFWGPQLFLGVRL